MSNKCDFSVAEWGEEPKTCKNGAVAKAILETGVFFYCAPHYVSAYPSLVKMGVPHERITDEGGDCGCESAP